MREQERKRLVELISDTRELCPVKMAMKKGRKITCDGCKYEHNFDCQMERIADKILADGWLRPPVKVGDRVYWIDDGEIKNEEVFEISIYGDGILVHTGIQFCLEQVFLTREEAEKALEGKEDEGK